MVSEQPARLTAERLLTPVTPGFCHLAARGRGAAGAGGWLLNATGISPRVGAAAGAGGVVLLAAGAASEATRAGGAVLLAGGAGPRGGAVEP
jgi:hypothetical protein